MPEPLLIMIGGPPATGKTTLGERLVQEFHLPFFSKDSLKEILFEVLGYSSQEQSRQLGLASLKVMYQVAEVLLKVGHSLILEAPYQATSSTEDFLALQARCKFKLIQVQCRTEGSMLVERHTARTENNPRHPGHFDRLFGQESRDVLLKGFFEPLEIGGQLFVIDTTDFNKIDYAPLFEAIKTALVQNA